MIASIGLCFTKMLQYGGINQITDQFMTVKLNLIVQGFDFIWIGMILYICRPRKLWPAYFTLPVNDLRRANGGRGDEIDENGNQPPPVLIGTITTQFLIDQYEIDRTNSIGSDDAVIFVNPTKYSLDKDNQEGSAFDDDSDMIQNTGPMINRSSEDLQD